MKTKQPASPSTLLSSMMGHALPDVREPAAARNEGHPIGVIHRLTGADVLTIGFDISKAPVPTRRYVAETCAVDVCDLHLRLIFCQRALGQDGELDSALVIRLSPQAAHNFVSLIGDMQDPSLETIAAAVGVQAAPLLERLSRPTHMAHLAANLAAIGVSGHESCIDFYQASPFSMRHIEAKKEIGVEPVVRVDISTSLLLSLFAAASALAKSLPPIQTPRDTR